MTAPALTHPGISPLLRLRVELRRLTNTRFSQGLLLGVGLFSIAVVWFYATTIAKPGASMYEYMVVGGQFIGFAVQIIAVLAMSADWRHRTALTTYALDPKRTRVLLSRLAALWLLGIAFTALAAAMGAVAGALAGATFAGASDVVSACFWLAVHVTISVLIGAALGAAFQSVAPALVIALIGPQMVPSIIAFLSEEAARWTDYLNPLTAAITGREFTGEVAPFAASLVLWILLPLAIGIWRNLRQDVG